MGDPCSTVEQQSVAGAERTCAAQPQEIALFDEFYQPVMEAMLAPLVERGVRRVLEIGSGHGTTARRLAAAGLEVVATDKSLAVGPTAQGFETIADRNKAVGAEPVPWAVADAEAL